MRKPRRDGQETRRNLLQAACRVFAARGFWDATLAEICKQAGANTAAANYYFGGKEALYVESWRYAFRKSLEAYPVDGGADPDASVEERLRRRVLSIMRRIIDPESQYFDIVHKELANPTGLLADAMQESMGVISREFVSIVRELLGDEASEQQVRLCHMSIRAQCFGPLLRERRLKTAFPGPQPPGIEPILDDVETLADHVTRFSLAGIRAVRRRTARGDSVGKGHFDNVDSVMHRGQL